MSIDEQFDVINAKVMEITREALKDKKSALYAAKVAKDKANEKYKDVQFDTLTNDTSFALVHEQVIRTYVKEWGKDKGVDTTNFLQWIDLNGKLSCLDAIIDTRSKADTFLNNLFKSYQKGKETARRSKAEIEAEKAKKADLYAKMLAAFNAEELKEMAKAKEEEKEKEK